MLLIFLLNKSESLVGRKVAEGCCGELHFLVLRGDWRMRFWSESKRLVLLRNLLIVLIKKEVFEVFSFAGIEI